MEQSLVDQVWKRADSICEYCRMPQQFDVLTFQIDHVIARKHHGIPLPYRFYLVFNVESSESLDEVSGNRRRWYE